jgi:hypothetical protein
MLMRHKPTRLQSNDRLVSRERQRANTIVQPLNLVCDAMRQENWAGQLVEPKKFGFRNWDEQGLCQPILLLADATPPPPREGVHNWATKYARAAIFS